jgi:hypothetical protein
MLQAAVPIGSSHLTVTASMAIAFTQQAMSRVSPIEKPQIAEFYPRHWWPRLLWKNWRNIRTFIHQGHRFETCASCHIQIPLVWSWSNETDPSYWASRDSTGFCLSRRWCLYSGSTGHTGYTSYACHTKEHLKDWDIVHKVSPHGRLPVLNDEDYNFNTTTYDGEFYQEEGLQGGSR